MVGMSRLCKLFIINLIFLATLWRTASTAGLHEIFPPYAIVPDHRRSTQTLGPRARCDSNLISVIQWNQKQIFEPSFQTYRSLWVFFSVSCSVNS
ncbi:hypothetical protein EDC04DRAFT_1276221 [Pisolithus marmoratus]|nr:hypothetical protein EDC04DRAFT_1276221 [Pisolithus marmoratus]